MDVLPIGSTMRMKNRNVKLMVWIRSDRGSMEVFEEICWKAISFQYN